jgi:hypothetical protein
MALRFHIDEDAAAGALISALRVRKVDITTAAEAGLKGADDRAQLLWASNARRVVLTHNVGDFCRLHTEFLNSDLHHSGIIVVQQQKLSIGERVRRILRLSAALDSEAMRDRLEFLSHW